jgi:hypothetical protein
MIFSLSMTGLAAVVAVLVINHWLEPWIDRRIKARRSKP